LIELQWAGTGASLYTRLFNLFQAAHHKAISLHRFGAMRLIPTQALVSNFSSTFTYIKWLLSFLLYYQRHYKESPELHGHPYLSVGGASAHGGDLCEIIRLLWAGTP
jgi:hypothetical protein